MTKQEGVCFLITRMGGARWEQMITAVRLAPNTESADIEALHKLSLDTLGIFGPLAKQSKTCLSTLRIMHDMKLRAE